MAKERVYAVVGLGSFGKRVCEVLSEKGGKVIALDNRPQVIESIKNQVTQAVLVNSTDEEALSAVPLEDVDVAIVAIGDNIEASILTTALLKGAGVPYIIARAVSDLHQRVLKQVGADEIINLEIDQGTRMALKLISPEVLERIPITRTISMAEIYAPPGMVGKSLLKLELRSKAHINVVALRRISVTIDKEGNALKEEKVVFPGPEEVIEESDILIVVGKNEDIDALEEYE